MPTDPKSAPERRDDRPLSSPYGPQRGHVDEAAGGADSSPLETEPPGERKDKAADPVTDRPSR
jgi:hypothetical protein